VTSLPPRRTRLPSSNASRSDPYDRAVSLRDRPVVPSVLPSGMPNRSSKTPKRPRDFNANAFQSVAILTGTAEPPPKDQPEDPLRAAAAALGRRGGLKGGKARAAKLSPEERSEIARKAAAARWKRTE
jgi:hypothetical protein